MSGTFQKDETLEPSAEAYMYLRSPSPLCTGRHANHKLNKKSERTNFLSSGLDWISQSTSDLRVLKSWRLGLKTLDTRQECHEDLPVGVQVTEPDDEALLWGLFL